MGDHRQHRDPPVYRAGSHGCSQGTARSGGSAGVGSLYPGRSKRLQPRVLRSVHGTAMSQGGWEPCLLWLRRWVVTRGGRTAAPDSLPLVVGGRTSLFFILFFFLFKKPQPSSTAAEVVGFAGAALGAAELKLKLVSWLAPAFCGAQRSV